MSKKSTTNLTYVNPRYIEGAPHEVAAKAAYQAIQVLKLARKALEDSAYMARNSWQTAEFARTNDMPDGDDFWLTAQGLRWTRLQGDIELKIQPEVEILKKAAAFNPMATLPKE